MILFINQTWNLKYHVGLFKRLVQISLISIAYFTALSRISDNKHHPTDVIAGALLGTLISGIVFIVICRFLNNEKKFSKNLSIKSTETCEKILLNSTTITL